LVNDSSECQPAAVHAPEIGPDVGHIGRKCPSGHQVARLKHFSSHRRSGASFDDFFVQVSTVPEPSYAAVLGDSSCN
jgi:hypothetical protein